MIARLSQTLSVSISPNMLNSILKKIFEMLLDLLRVNRQTPGINVDCYYVMLWYILMKMSVDKIAGWLRGRSSGLHDLELKQTVNFVFLCSKNGGQVFHHYFLLIDIKYILLLS